MAAIVKRLQEQVSLCLFSHNLNRIHSSCRMESREDPGGNVAPDLGTSKWNEAPTKNHSVQPISKQAMPKFTQCMESARVRESRHPGICVNTVRRPGMLKYAVCEISVERHIEDGAQSVNAKACTLFDAKSRWQQKLCL